MVFLVRFCTTALYDMGVVCGGAVVVLIIVGTSQRLGFRTAGTCCDFGCMVFVDCCACLSNLFTRSIVESLIGLLPFTSIYAPNRRKLAFIVAIVSFPFIRCV